MARTQRVQNFISNFMEYHNKGYSVSEIAEIFCIDVAGAYRLLQEIADAHNVSRSELLQRKSCAGYVRSNPFMKENVDMEKLSHEFREIETHIDNLVNQIELILQEDEK